MKTNRSRVDARKAGRLLDSLKVAKTSVLFEPSETIFAQGDRCDSVMYLERGCVRLSVVSPAGRAAVVAILEPGAFFGEGALAGQRRRKSTAETMTGCTITMVKTAEMRRRLHEEVVLSEWFRTHLLARNARIEEDLVAEVFNRSEKRLARALLLLAGFDEHQSPWSALPKISRTLLAEMSGATRSQVEALMNTFRERGFLERYPGLNGGVQVHRSLLSVVLQD